MSHDGFDPSRGTAVTKHLILPDATSLGLCARALIGIPPQTYQAGDAT